MVAFELRGRDEGKEGAIGPDAELARLLLADLDQAVEALAVDQRLEAAADMDVGRGLAGRRVEDDADRVVGAGGDAVVDLGDEGQPLVAAAPSAVKSTATKGASSTVMPTFSTGVTRK